LERNQYLNVQLECDIPSGLPANTELCWAEPHSNTLLGKESGNVRPCSENVGIVMVKNKP
jgi:hypothetical protein